MSRALINSPAGEIKFDKIHQRQIAAEHFVTVDPFVVGDDIADTSRVRNADGYGNSYGYVHTDSYTHTYAYSYSYNNSDLNADSNGCEANTDAKAASNNTTTAPVGHVSRGASALPGWTANAFSKL